LAQRIGVARTRGTESRFLEGLLRFVESTRLIIFVSSAQMLGKQARELSGWMVGSAYPQPDVD
jgi:hypothetical protein